MVSGDKEHHAGRSCAMPLVTEILEADHSALVWSCAKLYNFERKLLRKKVAI